MNTMTYRLKHICTLVLFALLAYACDKSGDKIYLSGLEGNELISMETDVVLTQEVENRQVLALAWTSQTLQLSNSNMQVPNVLSTALQVSTSADFSGAVAESNEGSLSKSFSGAELNAVAKNIGAPTDVPTPFYFRLRGSIGENIAPVYSNVVTVNVTPYSIDMTVGYILDANMEATGATLCSPNSNGVYRGFMGAAAWGNFYMREGDGKIWGNDGVEGTPFLMSAEDDANLRWNFWFPGQTGCYYVEVNTPRKVWSARYVSSLTVSGDVNAEMSFDRTELKWTANFTADGAGTVNVYIAGTGKQYDYATGTDDAAATDAPIYFAADGSGVVMAETAGVIAVQVPAAGEYTLVLDLNDPNNWTCEAVSGVVIPEQIYQYLYLPGVDDGISGSWTFDNKLTLYYNGDQVAYAGVVNVNSQWGYGIYLEVDNWTDLYNFGGEGNAYAGTLEKGGSTNIPAPEAGLYLFDVSLVSSTYALSPVGNEVYIVGVNDVWDFNTPLVATSVVGVYEGVVEVLGTTTYGFKIHIDSSWNHSFGGSGGVLYYGGNDCPDLNAVAPGTYTVKVDLINNTYTIQ